MRWDGPLWKELPQRPYSVECIVRTAVWFGRFCLIQTIAFDASQSWPWMTSKRPMWSSVL